MSQKKLIPIQTEEDLTHAITLAGQLADARIRDDQINHPNPFADRLIKACQDGNINELKALLLAGASPNVVREAGTPATCAVVSTEPVAILNLLIGASVDLNLQDRNGWNPLFVAAGNSLVDGIRFLVKAGADINAQSSTNGWTALMNAACFGYVNSIVELLALGADLNLRSSDGMRAVDIAAGNGRVQVLHIFKKYAEIKLKS